MVFEPVNQISRARNAGAGAASGDWLLFVDADSSPSRELVEEMLDGIESGRCVGGGCTVRLPLAPPGVRAWVAAWNLTSRAMRADTTAAVSFVNVVCWPTMGRRLLS